MNSDIMMRMLLLFALIAGVVKADNLLYKVQQAPNEEHIVCPNLTSKCPKTATCCQLPTSQWGCCPFPQASCCSDKVHCCPQGYSCNADKGQCVKAINNETIPWAKKVPSPVSSSSSESSVRSNDITCADRTVCPGTAACCRTYAGSFRCCSYPNDVCCSDGFSCCPRCTICDVVYSRCLSGFTTEEWKPITKSTPSYTPSEVAPAAEKTPAIFIGESIKGNSLESLANLNYCNGTHYCQDIQTCCLLPGGVWGCCPYLHATCCSGSSYCCPPGKACSYPPGICL